MYVYGYFMVSYFIARIDNKLIHIILLSSIDGCYFKQHLQYGGPKDIYRSTQTVLLGNSLQVGMFDPM